MELCARTEETCSKQSVQWNVKPQLQENNCFQPLSSAWAPPKRQHSPLSQVLNPLNRCQNGKYRWQAAVNMAMNHRDLKRREIYWLSKRLVKRESAPSFERLPPATLTTNIKYRSAPTDNCSSGTYRNERATTVSLRHVL